MDDEPMIVMWTIFDHPADYPDGYVARLFVLGKPTENVIRTRQLDPLRGAMLDMGLVKLARMPEDHPHIVEVWM